MSSREIRFRAWDALTKEMYSHEQLCNPAGDGTSLMFSEFIGFGKHGVVVMQYTGLQDFNGNPIYEGDVLSTLGHTPEVGTVVTKVVWDENEARFIEVETDGCRYSRIDNGVSEVIGNIYANPTLFTEPQP